MKRIPAAVVAAAIAFPLGITPALGADQDETVTSSAKKAGGEKTERTSGSSVSDGEKATDKTEATKEEAIRYAERHKDEANSTVKNALDKGDSAIAPLASSLQSDYKQGWKPGTTFDILLGTLLPPALLALGMVILNSGVLAGVQLLP